MRRLARFAVLCAVTSNDRAGPDRRRDYQAQTGGRERLRKRVNLSLFCRMTAISIRSLFTQVTHGRIFGEDREKGTAWRAPMVTGSFVSR
jgi:hypothetical protein